MSQGWILSPQLFDLYTASSLIRDAEMEDMGIKTGGKLVYNQRYADIIARYA